ncbi:hypothetical protein [Mycobacterium shimoidei]|nr:hypothetical protein [Mycobacterium shimoidei]MCV7260934.1 hypothetical protein [Mycobacterium shimoidei]ODR13530.1 hypothetical protein BHQ16_09275 [Mycobacterium shimoidei]ORW76557.1 hypothetical protein AWC26_21195 [Mycobacterium shimoidei]
MGVFSAAAMMSAVSAPTARADEFTDIINIVDGEFATGQSYFDLAATDFGSGDVPDGLAALFSGVDNDVFAVLDTVLVGTAAALTHEPIGLLQESFAFEIGASPNLLTDFIVNFGMGESYLTAGVEALSAGGFSVGIGDLLNASEYVSVFTAEALLVGGLDLLGL